MAYFSNRSEGRAFEACECANCIHRSTEDHGCAVLDAHMPGDPGPEVQQLEYPLRSLLSMLIDDENHELGSMCQMRFDRDAHVPTDEAESVGCTVCMDGEYLAHNRCTDQCKACGRRPE